MKINLPVRFAIALLLLVSAVQTAKAQCGQLFYDGFESGTLGPQWQTGTNTFTASVTNTAPAVGTYSLECNYPSGGAFYQGKYTVFTGGQPTYLSWRIKTNTTTGANGYLIAGDANIASDNGILFAYCNATSGLRFFNTTGYNYPITANTWYFVEARDIDWVNRNMDIWINGVLILTNWAFRSNTATQIDRIHLHSLTGSIASYDEIIVGLPGVTISNPLITNAVCNGDANGAIDISASSQNGITGYAWSNAANTQDISNLAAGVYTVTVTDGIGCTAVDSFTVGQPAVIAANGAVSNPSCTGGTNGAIDLTPSGGNAGFSFTWSSGPTTEDISGIGAGNYSVTLTDSLGCTAVDSFSVSDPLPFGISASITEPSCNGDSTGTIDVTLSNGVPGFVYAWSNGAATEDLSGIGAGTYIVNVTDTNGCTATDTLVVNEPQGILVQAISTDPLCNGDANGAIDISVLGGTPGYTFTWSNAQTTEDLSGLVSGFYSVTVTDSMGCSQVLTDSLSSPSAMGSSGTITDDLDGTANGAVDLSVTGGSPGYTFLWSNAATTEDISGLSAGTYTVTITDANGCTHVDTFTVSLVLDVSSAGAAGLPVNVWPNPFGNQFNVDFGSFGAEPAVLQLMDAQGKVVWSRENASATASATAGILSVDVALAPGMYFLRVYSGRGNAMLRLICH